MNKNEVSWNLIGTGPMSDAPNLYPEKLELQSALSEWLSISPANIIITAGGDQLIEIFLLRVKMNGGKKVAIQTPSFGLFAERATLLGLEVIPLELNCEFDLDSTSIERNDFKVLRADALILCTPNNPSGNLINRARILQLLDVFKGDVLIDQAYLEFVSGENFADLTSVAAARKNVLSLRTFSKAWGLAGLRVGYGIASAELCEDLGRYLTPYNVSRWSLNAAQNALTLELKMRENAVALREKRDALTDQLSQHDSVVRVFPSVANFLLIEYRDRARLETFLGPNKERLRYFNGALAGRFVRLTVDLNMEACCG